MAEAGAGDGKRSDSGCGREGTPGGADETAVAGNVVVVVVVVVAAVAVAAGVGSGDAEDTPGACGVHQGVVGRRRGRAAGAGRAGTDTRPSQSACALCQNVQ